MIDRQALIAKVQAISELDNETKSQLLELLHERKRYGLVWEDKPEDVEERLRKELPVLKEVKEKAIISDSTDAPNHILIEGDNLEALTSLTYTHEGMIDVIYIDPPYNTGKDNFTYNDCIVDKEDQYRHSKWLSFMEKRLKIARKLLSPTGVILISIDDYSFAQLKLLCDSIFEHSSNPDNWNFLSTLIWNKQHSQQQGTFKKYHEYIFVYARNAANVNNVLSEASGVIEAGAMKKISVKNPASPFSFPAGISFDAPDGTRIVGEYGGSEKMRVLNGELVAKDGKTVYPVTLEAGWTQKKQMQSWVDGKETYDTKGQKVIEFYFNSTGKVKCRKERAVLTPCSILPEFGMGSEQTAHLEDILGKKDMFSNPKPVEMIKLFVDWFCPPTGLVLDFFAGSGTTLESVMCLNNEAEGHRQCILVTNNENNICEDVTYERNKRVINGYINSRDEYVDGLRKNTLRYYKTDFIARESSQTAKRELMAASTDMLCIKNDIYTENETFGGKKFRKDMVRFFGNEDKQMLIIYNARAIEPVVDIISEMTVTKPIIVYVFSLNDYAMDADFETVADKVSLCALPDAILRAYRRVLPKKRMED